MARALEGIAPQSAERLLAPILRVLSATGLSDATILRITCQLLEDTKRRRGPAIKVIPHDSRLESIVGRWYAGIGYSHNGEPSRLRIYGKRPSFECLVRSISATLVPEDVLRDLRRLRVIRRQGQHVVLVRKFVPFASTKGLNLTAATFVAEDFLRAWEAGLLGKLRPGKGLFLRAAHNLHVERAAMSAFDAFARDQGQLLLESVDHWLAGRAARATRTHTKTRNVARLGLGIYVINDGLKIK